MSGLVSFLGMRIIHLKRRVWELLGERVEYHGSGQVALAFRPNVNPTVSRPVRSGGGGRKVETKIQLMKRRTRDFWRELEDSPTNQGYHYNQNAETYLLVRRWGKGCSNC